jgi:hypothetical protein
VFERISNAPSPRLTMRELILREPGDGFIDGFQYLFMVRVHGALAISLESASKVSGKKLHVHTKNIVYSAFLGSLIGIAGCSSAPEPQKQTSAPIAEKPAPQAEALTGRNAFQRLYAAARNWSTDSQPIRMESRPRSGDKADGTASIWVAVFASPSKQQTRSFLWSGAVGEDEPEQGISPGSMDTFSPGNVSTRPFDTAYLKIDTDKALTVANKKGGAALLKKKPDQLVRFLLNWEREKNRLIWRVVYGISEHDAPLRVDVNASTAEFVKIAK